MSRRSALAGLAASYAALAVLVAAGALTGPDRWATEHLMPGAGKPGPAPSFLESLIPLYHVSFGNAWARAAQVVTLPGQVLVSLAILAAAAEALRRRGRADVGAAWLAAWALGTALEVVCKEALVRPALYRDGLHVVAFDDSWPSGHTLRCALVAGALATLLPRARPLLAVWLAAALVLLVALGAHTPSDLAGGLLLAALLGLAGRELERSGLLRRRAALRARRPAAASRRA
ncbi:MAG TPA: phosphatase PAP2 family protein [Gaiellaceae bacterium]|nr:phosphatase PAP2 family protein [Gaiellaceae bacterium]